MAASGSNERERETDADVIASIRLGLEVAADDRTALRLVRALLEMAPASDGRAARPVDVLLRGIRAIKGTLHLTDHEPRGRIVRRSRG